MTLEKKLVEHFMNHIEIYQSDFEDTEKRVADSKAIYKGAPVPYLHIPKFYTSEDVKTFKAALAGIHDVVNRTIELYLNEPSVRELFQFDEKLDALIRLPHGYTTPVPMGRFDIFYYGPDKYMFCELNADGASAMNEEHEISQILSTTALMKHFETDFSFKRYELFHSWVREVKLLYGEFSKDHKSPNQVPVVAIVDFIDKGSSIEFEVFKSAFETGGYTCLIVDPRDIHYRDGYMYTQEKRIDIVYRRLVTKDMMDHYDEIPEFIKGIESGKTCLIGSIKTQIVHTKRFFQVLHEPHFRTYLTPEQLDFVDAHVPFTRPLKSADIPLYSVSRSEYIIKPVDYYASKGVCAGKDYSDEAWKSLLFEKANEDFIVQRYCPLALVDNIRRNSEGQFEALTFSTITGLFTYNEKLSGMYVRAGLHAIISGLHEGYTMSTLEVTSR